MRTFFTRPAGLVAIPALLSLVVWLYGWPNTIRRGFTDKEHLTVSGLAYVLGWYLLLIMVASLTWRAGRETQPLAGLDGAEDDEVYRYLTLIGAVGVIGIYLLVSLHDPGLVFRAFAEHQFNQVKEATPQAAGLGTLRYASILAGAVAMHRLVIMRQVHRVHFFNLLMLLLNVLLASRLALIMSLLIFAGLSTVRRRADGRRVRKGRVAVLILVAIVVLGIANYSRNANYYETYYDTRNPVTMLLSESVAYLGSPFQVEAGTANAALNGYDPASNTPIAANALQLATPTFASPATGHFVTQQRWYNDSVDIQPSLTTNSALAAEFGLLGNGAFLFMALVCAIAGFLMGHLSRYKSLMILGSFVIGYCFAEIWRTYLFSEGIVWFLMILLVIVCGRATQTSKNSVALGLTATRLKV